MFIKKIAFGCLLALILGSGAIRAASPSIMISEIQTGSATSASQEFVELYNPTDHDVALAGWNFDYKSATGSSWTHKLTLSGTIRSHGFYLLGATGYAIGADQTFASGLSGTGGHVRIADNTSTLIDLVGWGTAVGAEGSHPASAPAAGQSVERLPGRLNDSGGNGIDTDDNANDFIVRSVPEPQNATAATEVPDLTITTPPPPADEAAPDAPVYLPIMITELLPDPASPKTDSQDEFVELFNPNSQDVNLHGYTIRTGTSFHYFYVLPLRVLPAGGYAVFYSGISHLSLANSGGAAQLLDPAGTVVSQTNPYPAAKSDQAWGLFEGVWKWTLAVTPGADNVLEEPEVAVKVAVTAAAPKVAAAKTPKATTTTAPKTSKAAAKAPAAPKAKATAKSAFANVSEALANDSSTGRWLIIGLATLTIAYALYEFRTNLQNYLYRARTKFGPGRKDRPHS